MRVRRVAAVLHQPEYTGENRCLPCTAINLLIVAAGAATLAVVGAAVAAVAVAVVGVLVLYFRGYVVPGTPALTRRYLPDRIHDWFGHDDAVDADFDTDDDTGGQFDPEDALMEAGALRPCMDRDDLCLDSQFRASWRTEMPAVEAAPEDALDRMLPDSVTEPATLEYRGDAVYANVGEASVAEWPSRAAFVADAAGAVVLADADPDWSDRTFSEQTRLLAGLRLWLDQCSLCEGTVELGEESVESCCRSIPVVAATCESCNSRIFEAPLHGD